MLLAFALAALAALNIWRLYVMSATIDRLTASVANLATVDDSLIELVKNLAQTIRNNAEDPAALTALADRLDAEAQTVADAVTANTPEPEPLTAKASDAKANEAPASKTGKGASADAGS